MDDQPRSYGKRNWKKMIFIVIFLIFLIAIPAAMYYLSASSATTVNWKVHTDSQYYSLKVPPEFEIRNEESDKRIFEEERSFNSPAGSFRIVVSRVKSGKQIEEMTIGLMPPITVDEIQISKASAKRWHGFSGVAGVNDTTVLIFEYKNVTYLIQSWFPRGGKFDQFPQILQTFEFLDQKADTNNLEDRLNKLIQSSDRQLYAQQNGIFIRNNKVRVIIEMKDPTQALSSEFGEKEAFAGTKIQALIEIDKLLSLAENLNVINITLPLQAVPLSQ